MKKNLIFMLLLAVSSSALAQSTVCSTINDVLALIERNNSTLAAQRKQAEADKLGNKTGIYLDAPEVGYNFLFGHPAEVGKRHDITVSQSFDLATVSGKRSKVADGQNALVDCSMRAERMSILLEAKQCLIDLIYYNASLRQLNERRNDAVALKEAGKRMLDAGECSKMDYNNVQLACMEIEAELLKMEADRQQALQDLARLNGGQPVAFVAEKYEAVALERDFSAWYASVSERMPDMEYALGDIELNRRLLSLAKTENLPDVSLGYMSEKTQGEHFQGVTFGLSIPLWSNRNKVRQARAAVSAAEARKEDKSLQLRSQFQMLHTRVLLLSKVADVCREAVSQYDRSLLQRALAAGEISKIDFFLQSSAYYEVVDKALAAEHEYQSLLAQLMAVENL